MADCYDPVRLQHVSQTPEEKVRQALLHRMIGELGFPRGLLAVEKPISALVPVTGLADPNRRIDILCFMPKSDGLSPLLLVECKADGSISRRAEEQVLGYNLHIRAPFVALATPGNIKTGWQEEKGWVFAPFLPPFKQLVDAVLKQGGSSQNCFTPKNR